MQRLITVIGRGNSGTRAISHTLSESGVFMGDTLNESGDLLPPDELYEACRVMSRYVIHEGGLRWNFSNLHTGPIDSEFTRLVNSYLSPILSSEHPAKGWKLPETTLILPWIVRMFPDIHYIYWLRDPRDAVLGFHPTDDLADFGVPYEKTRDKIRRRAISWRYHFEIMKSTASPRHRIDIRFEDFVLRQDRELARLEEFLGIPMARIPVRPEAVGRWRRLSFGKSLRKSPRILRLIPVPAWLRAPEAMLNFPQESLYQGPWELDTLL